MNDTEFLRKAEEWKMKEGRESKHEVLTQKPTNCPMKEHLVYKNLKIFAHESLSIDDQRGNNGNYASV